MKWIKKEPKLRSIEAMEIGSAVLHNVMCWVCEKEPAVYSMNPDWIFRPCWKCQKKGIGSGKIMHHWLLKFISRFVDNY